MSLPCCLPLQSFYFSLVLAVATPTATNGSYLGMCGGKNINPVAFLCTQLIKQFCILLKRNQFLDTDNKMFRNLLLSIGSSDN